MPRPKHESCIEACNLCVMACNHCAASCLQERDVQAMARCIALDLDCAAICATASALMARDSDHADALYAACADICIACGEECAKHDMAHCQACARACKHCAEACHDMVATA